MARGLPLEQANMTDIAPTKDLRAFGYAPGEYMHSACSECAREFIADKRSITCMHCAESRAAAKPVEQSAEVILLRRRIKNQRRELRRLNRQLTWFWQGMTADAHLQRSFEYRKKMIDAFGIKAVCKAEGHPI
jgi:DNA-directed RNA polymerase subunit RPC12/RpoP